jgi:hypothetical protein
MRNLDKSLGWLTVAIAAMLMLGIVYGAIAHKELGQ